ncbi:methyl-accepting chemotaxis sensory transducer domain protein [Burkholderia cepacia]|nr:methyl-accepting chemotaxis sensory transducer domain protein [Burkholderia cepacia]
MLVWNAMPSMMPVMSAIFDELWPISVIVSTTRPTTELPRCATSDAFAASVLACCAFSAFRRTVDVNSSIVAAVSCSDAACSSVRWLRSRLPDAISLTACAMLFDESRTRPTMPISRSFIVRSASSRSRVSSLPRTSMRLPRSPFATVRATSTAALIGTVILRVSHRPPQAAIATAIRQMPASRLRSTV